MDLNVPKCLTGADVGLHVACLDGSPHFSQEDDELRHRGDPHQRIEGAAKVVRYIWDNYIEYDKQSLYSMQINLVDAQQPIQNPAERLLCRGGVGVCNHFTATGGSRSVTRKFHWAAKH